MTDTPKIDRGRAALVNFKGWSMREASDATVEQIVSVLREELVSRAVERESHRSIQRHAGEQSSAHRDVLLTAREARERLSISPATMFRWERQYPELAPVRINSRKFYRRADIEKFVATRHAESCHN